MWPRFQCDQYIQMKIERVQFSGSKSQIKYFWYKKSQEIILREYFMELPVFLA